MESELRGTTAIVTGASSGIGRVMAKRLAGLGVVVVAAGRSKERLDELVATTEGTIYPLIVDLADIRVGQTLVDHALAVTGRLDTVIANAGLYRSGPVWETPLDEIEKLISINVTGAIATVHAAIAHMIPLGKGDIVVTSSVSGHQALHWEPVYSASKHAVQAFVHGVRWQLAGSGVRIGSVSPGTVLTELWAGADPRMISGLAATGQALQADDVVEAMLFMLTRPRNVTVRDLVLLATNQEI